MNNYEKLCKLVEVKLIELDHPDNYDAFYPEFTAEKKIRLLETVLCFTREIPMFELSFVPQDSMNFKDEFEIHCIGTGISKTEEDLFECLCKICIELVEKGLIRKKEIKQVLEE